MPFHRPRPTPAPPPATEVLITQILGRRHVAHRRLLTQAIRLATTVERTHAIHPACPHGLADLLFFIGDDLEDHRQKEEAVLFPLMLSDAPPPLAEPLSRMRRDHDDLADQTQDLRALTCGFTPPADADAAWRALYALCARIDAGLNAHITLENEVLFPRFGADQAV